MAAWADGISVAESNLADSLMEISGIYDAADTNVLRL